MPRYSTREPPTLAPEDQGAAGGRRGPTHVHRDLRVPHLAAAARPVVVGVDALRRSRAVVVGGAPELAHVLDHHAHPVSVALAEVTPARVVRASPAQLDGPRRHVGAALALSTEAVLLELEHGREREGVVGAGHVDVLGPDPGGAEDE